MNNSDHLCQIYRSNNILDEKVLRVIKKVNRENFVPEPYKSFSYCDIAIPLKEGNSMLHPSCEGKIIQDMQFHKNDSVLLIGTGSGYLTECISHLTNTVSAYECDDMLFQTSKHNLDSYSKNRHKVYLYKENIFKDLNKIQKYTKVIFTCSVKSYDFFLEHLGQDARAFVFLWESKSPYSKGIILDNTRNGYTVTKNIVTSQSNLIKER